MLFQESLWMTLLLWPIYGRLLHRPAVIVWFVFLCMISLIYWLTTIRYIFVRLIRGLWPSLDGWLSTVHQWKLREVSLNCDMDLQIPTPSPMTMRSIRCMICYDRFGEKLDFSCRWRKEWIGRWSCYGLGQFQSNVISDPHPLSFISLFQVMKLLISLPRLGDHTCWALQGTHNVQMYRNQLRCWKPVVHSYMSQIWLG